MKLSCGIIPALWASQEWTFLILRAFNYWDFPKGLREDQEDPQKAALRELKEEADISDVTIVNQSKFFETLPYSNGKIARYYLGLVTSSQVSLPISEELGKAEHDEFRWLNYQKARQLLVPRVQEALDWAYLFLGERALD